MAAYKEETRLSIIIIHRYPQSSLNNKVITGYPTPGKRVPKGSLLIVSKDPFFKNEYYLKLSTPM